MKSTVITIAFAPIAVSILCGVFIAVNSAYPIMQAWPIWGLLIVSTIFSLSTVAVMLLTGVTQWFMQYMKKQTV